MKEQAPQEEDPEPHLLPPSRDPPSTSETPPNSTLFGRGPPSSSTLSSSRKKCCVPGSWGAGAPGSSPCGVPRTHLRPCRLLALCVAVLTLGNGHCDAHPCILEVSTEASLFSAVSTGCAAACFAISVQYQPLEQQKKLAKKATLVNRDACCCCCCCCC